MKNNEIDYTENALLSYFGRVQYALMDRYLFSASLEETALLNLVPKTDGDGFLLFQLLGN